MKYLNIKGVSIPFSFVVFLILILIVMVMVLIWHFSGFEIFKSTTDNVTHGFVNNTTGGQISGP